MLTFMLFKTRRLQQWLSVFLRILSASMAFQRSYIQTKGGNLSHTLLNISVQCWVFIRPEPGHTIHKVSMVEPFNRTLIEQQGEWDDYLSQVSLAYNTSPHSLTGFTPFFLTHSREARLQTNLLLPNVYRVLHQIHQQIMLQT